MCRGRRNGQKRGLEDLRKGVGVLLEETEVLHEAEITNLGTVSKGFRRRKQCETDFERRPAFVASAHVVYEY